MAFADGWDKVDGLDRAIHRDILPNPRPECEQPGGARHGSARAVMLEAVAARIAVSIAAEVRHDEQRRAVFVLRHSLDGGPELAADAVRALDGIDVKRKGSGMSDIHIVQRDKQQRRRHLGHQPASDRERQCVCAVERPGIAGKVFDRKPQRGSELLQMQLAVALRK